MTLAISGTPAPSINRRLLADTVYDRVLADIVVGRHPPHERLNVDRLAVEFGVSRTPVREGLMRLQWDRFVDIAPNSRTSVAAWGAPEMRDRLEVVSRMTTFIAGDPRIPLTDLLAEGDRILADHHGDSPGRDAQAFLTLSEAIVSHAYNKIAAYTVRNLLTPLRLFLVEEIASRHRVDLASNSEMRCDILRRALRAARDGDRDAMTSTLGHYSDLLVGAVAPPVMA